MAPPTQSPTYQLADVLLGGEGALEEFVTERRAAGRSWRLVARDLYDATGGRVDVTYETLRVWVPDRSHTEASTPEGVS